MRVGVPSEVKDHEYRVSVTPAGVSELVRAGHEVLVQSGAGVGSGFDDERYQRSGARIATDADEVWSSAELVVKVKEPVASEYPQLGAHQTLFTYLHLAAAPELTDALVDSGTTAIAYETVETPDGRLPLLAPMSEIAGRMSAQVAAGLLEREAGGRGLLMGGVPGVEPARVVVLGAGMAGHNAARVAMGMGAAITVLDTNVDKLRMVDNASHGGVRTMASTSNAIDEQLERADVVIGSVLVPGAEAPRLVTEDHLAVLGQGAVLVDIAIDQGGCFATSRLTTHSQPTYVEQGVVHYCVGNMPGAVPQTSTRALSNVTLPYVLRLATLGSTAVMNDPALARGVNVWRGVLASGPVATAHDREWQPLADLLGVTLPTTP